MAVILAAGGGARDAALPYISPISPLYLPYISQVAAVETQLQRTLLDAKTMEDAVMANPTRTLTLTRTWPTQP